MVEQNIKGTEDFVNASDGFMRKIAKFLNGYEIPETISSDKLMEIKQLSEIVKINLQSIKELKTDSGKTKTPLEKMKSKTNGSQISV